MRFVRSRGVVDCDDIAGDGRGVIGQIRVVAVTLLIAGCASVVIGGLWWVSGIPRRTTAAAIEDGARPRTYGWRSRRYRSSNVEVVGHLVQGDAIVVQGPKVYVYAPLVSERLGADEHPRLYFGASSKVFDRAVTENRFRGRLMWLPFDVRQVLRSRGHAVADDAYLLQDNGFVEGDLAAGRAVVVWGLLLCALGLAASRYAGRRSSVGAGGHSVEVGPAGKAGARPR